MEMRPGKRRESTKSVAAGPTTADYFKSVLGFKPSNRPFHTAAKRQCGGCRKILPGSEFGVAITPGRPELNVCRECAGRS